MNKLLANGDIIPFNIVNSTKTNDIIFNSATSSFKVTTSGSYIVNYYINTNGTSANTNVKFSCNGIPCEATFAVEGQMSGFALLNLNRNDNISITNISGQDVRLGSNSIQAGIMIFKLV